MVHETDDEILEMLGRGLSITPRVIELNGDFVTAGRVSQRLGVLLDHGLVTRVEDGYYRITDLGRQYLRGKRIVNETETGNTYAGAYGSGTNEYLLYKNGEEWSPPDTSSGRLSWGDQGGNSGPPMVIRAILRDVTDEEEFDLTFLQAAARQFQLYSRREWTISQTLLIAYLKQSSPEEW
ncbi:ArsR/SmtB family transcription factor [Halorientalis persicus]|nr:helix-turn-helix transcriptional regulator [Halorientalis persicus]